MSLKKNKKVILYVVFSFIFMLECNVVVNDKQNDNDIILSEDISLKGEGIQDYKSEITKYDKESNEYKTILKNLENEYRVANMEVMDIALKDHKGSYVERDMGIIVELKLSDEIKEAKGNYLLLNKNHIINTDAIFKEDSVEFTYYQNDRIIICKVFKMNDGHDKKDEMMKISMTEAQITPIKNQKYTGKAITPSLTITYKDKTLIKDTDYIVSYFDNAKVGNARIVIKGINDYQGSVNVYFKIVEDQLVSNNNDEMKKISINNAHVSPVKDQKYSGNEMKPSITLKLGSKVLKKDVDYHVSYTNNINVGLGKIIIRGIGNYDGNITAYFKIVEGKKEMNTIRLNELTTHHGFKGYYTKDDNIIHVDKEKLGLNPNDSVSLYFIEYYDNKTKESILFVCPYVQEIIFMEKIDDAGGWDSVPVKVIE